MHLMISHANALEPYFEAALRELELPALSRLLGLLTPQSPDIGGHDGDADDHAPLPPHELFLARQRGLQDDLPPTAAWAVRAAGHDPGASAWALLTPVHFAISAEGVTAVGPQSLALDEAESRAFLDALSPLFPADEGWRAVWLGIDAWAIAHDDLDGLEAPSADRILNRPVETWMPQARRLRLLLNEMQMLLHDHPLNLAREERRERPLNAVWISGCGRDRGAPLPQGLTIDTRLRAPMVAGDLYHWSEAWKALDQGPVAELLRRAQAGEPVALTLSGERLARTWTRRPAGGWQRLKERFAPSHVAVADAVGAL
ncbi:MAG: hypothetical protein ABW220_16135 [Burkholderiaceae bacterium]